MQIINKSLIMNLSTCTLSHDTDKFTEFSLSTEILIVIFFIADRTNFLHDKTGILLTLHNSNFWEAVNEKFPPLVQSKFFTCPQEPTKWSIFCILMLSYLCPFLPIDLIFLLIPPKILYAYLLPHVKVKVKQSRYRPGVAQRVPGS